MGQFNEENNQPQPYGVVEGHLTMAVKGVNKMQSGLTSVVIPSFNRADYLPFTVASVLAQKAAEVEVIVVDDGSTDNTQAVVEEHRAKWGERFRYVLQENAERCVARNHGLEYANGEFVAFLDSDDMWRPNHVQLCLQALNSDSHAAAAYSDHGLIDDQGRIIREHVSRPAYDETRLKRELCLKQIIIFPAEVVIRRSALDSTYKGREVFDPEAVMLEEWLVWVNLLKSFSFKRVGEPTVWRRLHPNNTWANPVKFARQSVIASEKVIATGLPESLGIAARRLLAINQTHNAYGFYLAGNWSLALHHLGEALGKYPAVIKEPHFWTVVARLCVGKTLSRTIRAARHRGRTSLIPAESRTRS